MALILFSTWQKPAQTIATISRDLPDSPTQSLSFLSKETQLSMDVDASEAIHNHSVTSE